MAKKRLHLHIIGLLLPLLIAAGCAGNDFKIDFTFPEDVWLNLSIQYYASDKAKGFWLETTAPLDHGKGSVKCITRNPTLVQIKTSLGEPFLLYAERGDEIKVTGKTTEPSTWEASGNDINDELTQLRKKLPLNNRDSIAPALALTVKENRGSKAAMILLATLYPRAKDPEGFVRLWNSLDPDLKESELATLIGSADLGPNSGFERRSNGDLSLRGARIRIASIPLRTVNPAGDTLRTRGTGGSILYFWNSGSAGHQEFIDSLRELSRAFPDSSSRNITDICLNSDSLSWSYNIAGDSLFKTARGWTPLGLADRYNFLLGIPRTPYLIVTDSKGRQKYRGEDIRKATGIFRAAMRQKR